MKHGQSVEIIGIFNDNKHIKKIENPFDEDNYIKDSRQKNEGIINGSQMLLFIKEYFKIQNKIVFRMMWNNHQYLLI